MSSSTAKTYFGDELQRYDLPLEVFAPQMRERFEIVEHTRAVLQKWDFILLTSVRGQNKMKTGIEYFAFLVDKLTEFQAYIQKRTEAH